jgi:hypothetical protein
MSNFNNKFAFLNKEIVDDRKENIILPPVLFINVLQPFCP